MAMRLELFVADPERSRRFYTFAVTAEQADGNAAASLTAIISG
jgi:hypothetical protein